MDSAATECTINYRRLLILWQEFVQLSVVSGGSTHARRTGTHEKDTLAGQARMKKILYTTTEYVLKGCQTYVS